MSSAEPSNNVPETVLRLTCSRGTVEAKIGERFRWFDGSDWELVKLTDEWSYSPSGFGGTPTITCRHVGGELTGTLSNHTVGGLCDWCGDSVAAGIYWTRHASEPSTERPELNHNLRRRG